jgi:hypothetical protein
VNTISKQIQESIELKSKILNDPSMLKLIDEIIQIISTAFKQNKKEVPYTILWDKDKTVFMIFL